MLTQLRPHQAEAHQNTIVAIEAGNGTAVGRIVMPTGAGKTFVQAAALNYQLTHNSPNRLHLVLAPRIMLCNQLISEYRKFNGGSAYRVMAFHSGHWADDDEKAWKETSTTVVADIKNAYEAAKMCNQDLVVFSTYHSCNRLVNYAFDTIIADESQYCVTENFNDAVRSLSGRVKLFYTATERFTCSDSGRGLNNKKVYGERLYYISPAELIQKGIIVQPRLHVMYGKTKDEASSVVSEIIEMAVEQDKLTNVDLGFSKILFALKGTDDVRAVEHNLLKIHMHLPSHDIFTITSKNGAQINGVKVGRQQFMEELKTRKNCLIFHYDILSEGIDVDGITGVCLMRNMQLAKMLQTIGRAVRVYKPAPELKKRAWISVAVLNGDEDDKERVKRVVKAIRDGGFDISAEKVVETGILRHIPELEPMEDAYGEDLFKHKSEFIEDVLHMIEDEEFWNDVSVAETLEEKLDLLMANV